MCGHTSEADFDTSVGCLYTDSRFNITCTGLRRVSVRMFCSLIIYLSVCLYRIPKGMGVVCFGKPELRSRLVLEFGRKV
jgi:hypothetical protein